MLKVSNQMIQIEDLREPRENKDSGDDEVENSPKKTPNVQR
jgi:hypothetical protein